MEPTTVRRLDGVHLAEFLARHGLHVEVVNHLGEDMPFAETAWQRDPRPLSISSTFLPDRESVHRIAPMLKR